MFTRMPGDSYRRRLRSLWLGLSDVFRALITFLIKLVDFVSEIPGGGGKGRL